MAFSVQCLRAFKPRFIMSISGYADKNFSAIELKWSIFILTFALKVVVAKLIHFFHFHSQLETWSRVLFWLHLPLQVLIRRLTQFYQEIDTFRLCQVWESWFRLGTSECRVHRYGNGACHIRRCQWVESRPTVARRDYRRFLGWISWWWGHRCLRQWPGRIIHTV